MKKTSTEIEGKLIAVPPGIYLKAGSDSPAEIDFEKPVNGVVIKCSQADSFNAEHLLVLADGVLINMWSDEAGTVALKTMP